MHFPYGLSDFSTLIEHAYWYLDRTDRIAAIEAAGRQLTFLRPRRFGKSLLLSMLEHYPVVLSDMTSGYNVAKSVYLHPEFNDLCGFTEPEVTAVLERLATESGDWTLSEALAAAHLLQRLSLQRRGRREPL